MATDSVEKRVEKAVVAGSADLGLEQGGTATLVKRAKSLSSSKFPSTLFIGGREEMGVMILELIRCKMSAVKAYNNRIYDICDGDFCFS